MRSMSRVFTVVLLLASATALLTARPATTVPLFAAKQGLQCQTCHFDPNGGGPRNEFGFGFAKNRHSLEPETGEFADLTLTNRISETFPLYVGVNQRFMLLGSEESRGDGLDRLGFFNMENSLHLTFQPHSKLTMVYSRDGFNEASRSRDAFGMITLSPQLYLKAGQFRIPFGLRMDDHTVASRNGFLDFQGQGRVLPFDPRTTNRGLELGGEHHSMFARAAWTEHAGDNSGPLGSGSKSQTMTAKLGYTMPQYQGGVSFFDDWSDEDPGSFAERSRATRWGYYGMTHRGPFSLLAEVVAGTDELTAGDPMLPPVKVNSLGYFAELDYAPWRQWNFRLRYDRLELDRSSDQLLREANSFTRMSIEGEYVPMPFAELRWTLRYLDPDRKDDGLGNEPPSETQAYLQFHFSY